MPLATVRFFVVNVAPKCWETRREVWSPLFFGWATDRLFVPAESLLVDKKINRLKSRRDVKRSNQETGLKCSACNDRTERAWHLGR